jgi:hypothetical protein
MNECTHIGLDVHKDTIAAAVLRPGTTEVDERVILNTRRRSADCSGAMRTRRRFARATRRVRPGTTRTGSSHRSASTAT